MKLKAAVLAALAMTLAGTAMASDFDQHRGHRHRDTREHWMAQHDHRGTGSDYSMSGERHYGLNARGMANGAGMNGEQRYAPDARGMAGGPGMNGMQH